MTLLKNCKYSALIIVSLLSLLMSFNSLATQKSYRFDVYLNEDPIGYHEFIVEDKTEHEEVKIKAEFDVYFLVIPVYSYIHNNTEKWHNGCLRELNSSTDDNGDNSFVELTRTGSTTKINTGNNTTTSEECIRSFSYWNPEHLKTNKLLNAQTGEVLEVKFSYVGQEMLPLHGELVKSKRYQITGENLKINLWYNKQDEWIALNSQIDEEQTLRYVLQKGVKI